MEGYVYLIGTERFQWYKIGKSRTPEIRVGNLGILLPFKIQIFGIWKAQNHSLMESALHEQYAKTRINGEWFTFSKQTVKDLYSSIPAEACIFWHAHHNGSKHSKFSNMARDVMSPKPQPNPYPKVGIQLVEMP
jgi:hypothetical protein